MIIWSSVFVSYEVDEIVIFGKKIMCFDLPFANGNKSFHNTLNSISKSRLYICKLTFRVGNHHFFFFLLINTTCMHLILNIFRLQNFNWNSFDDFSTYTYFICIPCSSKMSFIFWLGGGGGIWKTCCNVLVDKCSFNEINLIM